MSAASSRHGRRRAAPTPSRRRRRARPEWADWPDALILNLRFCDLGLDLRGEPLRQRIAQLGGELSRRGIRFRPHFWLSDEWFSPDGVPGIALPFYLAHPRLMRLERRQMLEVEGGGHAACLRILRHEAGHALAHAHALHRRRRWQRLFGRSSSPYPEVYRPRPISKRFVHHLDHWYAQSHPDEDFAETFAVWLAPGSPWKKRYVGWPALDKLEYVDELMQEIGSSSPQVRARRVVEPVSELNKTLREHYRQRRSRYALGDPDIYDEDLKRLFSDDPAHAGHPAASGFIRRQRADLRRRVADWTGQAPYTIDQVLKGMIARCRALRLRVVGSERRVRQEFAVLLTVHTMNSLLSGRLRLAL